MYNDCTRQPLDNHVPSSGDASDIGGDCPWPATSGEGERGERATLLSPCSPPASPAGRGLGGAGVPGDSSPDDCKQSVSELS
ncbi:hypothetical protein PPACK8108_LOCUS12953 [Phakopsora pachyrhizi]|uniref:Uncharacterized protein n=1 Tax=Phakopsora pachyrhizi TaxID=170000 RepID=A0AAV0B2Q7_PHAPC|nr:hypothetical protein PPACK8108_LOCUS12953 [Phakopsora pachyrhizi]